MTNDDIRRVIDHLQRKCDEKSEEAKAIDRKGYEAFGMALGLAYAIGVLDARVRDD